MSTTSFSIITIDSSARSAPRWQVGSRPHSSAVIVEFDPIGAQAKTVLKRDLSLEKSDLWAAPLLTFGGLTLGPVDDAQKDVNKATNPHCFFTREVVHDMVVRRIPKRRN